MPYTVIQFQMNCRSKCERIKYESSKDDIEKHIYELIICEDVLNETQKVLTTRKKSHEVNHIKIRELFWLKTPLRCIHVIIHLSKHIECTTPRMNPNINYKLWVITMCQCWLISSNKCTTFRQDFDSRGSCANVGQEVYMQSLYLTLNFAVNLKVL